MRFFIYIFLISQVLNFIGVLTEKVKGYEQKFNSVTLGKVKEKSSSNLEANIIWETYKNDDIFSRKNLAKDHSENNLNNNQIVDIELVNNPENESELLIIEPHIPLNNYLKNGDFNFSSYWKSAFDGGVGRNWTSKHFCSI